MRGSSKVMKVSWGLSLGSSKVDPEAMTWLLVVTWEVIPESIKEGVRKIRPGRETSREKDMLGSGQCCGVCSWDPVRNHVGKCPSTVILEGGEGGAFIHSLPPFTSRGLLSRRLWVVLF